MEEQATREPEEYTEDLSGAEYVSRNDREKKVGYNGVPHRPTHPVREKQLRAVRSGERRREQDAG